MASKNKMFVFRIPEKLLNEYREFCDKNSLNISKRIRKFMELELENWKKRELEKHRKNNP